MTFAMSGEKQLLKQMEALSKAVNNKIGKKAITEGVKIVAKAIKKNIPSRQKSARKAIGYSFKRPRSGKFKDMIFAKAGAGAGMKKQKRAKMAASAKSRDGRKGVGIGVSNIMWLLEGTDKRYTGTKRKNRQRRDNSKGGFKYARVKTGKKIKYTGRMKRSGIVQKARAETQSQVAQTIKTWVMKGIAKEAGKL